MKTAVIFNPAARSERAARFRELIRKLGTDARLFPTEYAGHAIKLATEAARQGFDLLIAAGGDGTVSEVVTGIYSMTGALDRVQVGIVPVGTMNVFASELRIPLDPVRAWELLPRAKVRRIDLPILEARQPDGTSAIRPFVQLGGAGIDSLAISKVSWRLKKLVGPLAYALATAKVLLSRPIRVSVKTNDVCRSGRLILFGNGKLYGGRAIVFPQASLDDGRLDIRLFPTLDFASLIAFSRAWLVGGTVPLRNSHLYIQAEQFELQASDWMPVEVDGDNCGQLPATVKVEPARLQVLVPE